MFENANLSLIGLPGSGKSTLGCCLAKSFNMKFIDTDDFPCKINEPVRNTNAKYNYNKYFQSELSLLKDIITSNTIISTGGFIIFD